MEWPWAVVERGSLTPERRVSGWLLSAIGLGLPTGRSAMVLDESLTLNRRIRNRTSGDVGGRLGFNPHLLPDPS
jgi:hypothetical protein